MLQKQDPRSVIGMAQQRRPLLNSFYYPGTAGSRHVESRQSGGGVQISFDFYQRRTNFFRLQFSSGTRLGCPFSRHPAAASGCSPTAGCPLSESWTRHGQSRQTRTKNPPGGPGKAGRAAARIGRPASRGLHSRARCARQHRRPGLPRIFVA